MKYYRNKGGHIRRNTDKGYSWWGIWDMKHRPSWGPWYTGSVSVPTTFYRIPDTLCLLRGMDEIL